MGKEEKVALPNTHYGALTIERMLRSCQGIFFIGVGGISMSALARITKRQGYRVGGSDRTASEMTAALAEDGIEIFCGHSAAHLDGYDAVVYTVAIDGANPEYREAICRGLPVLSRSDYLGYLMARFSKRIGVSGMHGKSTCTAMCAHILGEAGDPTVLCGAELCEKTHSSCRIGSPDGVFLFEACEYMDSFLDFYPSLAVILNLGMDHVDYFHSMEQIRRSFRAFAERADGEGGVLCNADDSECLQAMEGFAGRVHSFALVAPAEFTAERICYEKGNTSFDFCRYGARLCRISISVCGEHNVYNALAAAAAAFLVGVHPEQIAKGLAGFHGAKRRMERKGSLNGAEIYDDYGHHPDEIKATLQGARQMGYRRVLCAYQPHTYSRTAGLLREFAEALDEADRVFMVDIYAAREQNVYGVSSEQVADMIGEKARYCGGFAETAAAIREEAREGDLVIVMGAGDITKVIGYLK
jgi:UDP-N-acetylmuramate--alanine ligase